MTTPTTIDAGAWLGKYLGDAWRRNGIRVRSMLRCLRRSGHERPGLDAVSNAGFGEQASELVIVFWRPARGLMRGQERLTSPRTPLVGA